MQIFCFKPVMKKSVYPLTRGTEGVVPGERPGLMLCVVDSEGSYRLFWRRVPCRFWVSESFSGALLSQLPLRKKKTHSIHLVPSLHLQGPLGTYCWAQNRPADCTSHFTVGETGPRIRCPPTSSAWGGPRPNPPLQPWPPCAQTELHGSLTLCGATTPTLLGVWGWHRSQQRSEGAQRWGNSYCLVEKQFVPKEIAHHVIDNGWRGNISYWNACQWEMGQKKMGHS